jgi:hypothetical protein
MGDAFYEKFGQCYDGDAKDGVRCPEKYRRCRGYCSDPPCGNNEDIEDIDRRYVLLYGVLTVGDWV